MLGYTLADLYLLGPKAATMAIDPFGDINDQLHAHIQSCTYNDCRGQVMVDADGVEYEFGVSGNFGDCSAEISVSSDTDIIDTSYAEIPLSLRAEAIAQQRSLYF